MNRREEYWVLTEQLRREPPELESAVRRGMDRARRRRRAASGAAGRTGWCVRRFRGDGERLPGLCHLLRQGAGPAGAGRGGGLLSQPAGGGGARLCAVYRPDRGGGQDLRYCGVCHRLPSQGTPVLFCGGRRPGVLGAPDAGRHPPGRIQLRPVQRNGRRGGGIAAHGVPFQPGGTPEEFLACAPWNRPDQQGKRKTGPQQWTGPESRRRGKLWPSRSPSSWTGTRWPVPRRWWWTPGWRRTASG